MTSLAAEVPAPPGHYLLPLAQAGIAFGDYVDVAPGLASTVVELFGRALSQVELSELLEPDAQTRSDAMRLLAQGLAGALSEGVRHVEITSTDSYGRGWRARYVAARGPQIVAHRDPEGSATRVRVVHRSRLGWARRRRERNLISRHGRRDGGVLLDASEATSGGIEARLGARHVSWSREHGDARALLLGYEPDFGESVAILFAHGVRVEQVSLAGPAGFAALIDRPWTREGLSLHVQRDDELEAWLSWTRAWAKSELSSLLPGERRPS